MIEGCAAEVAHRAEGGSILGEATSPRQAAAAAAPYPAQPSTAAEVDSEDADLAAAKYDRADFGFDDPEFHMVEDEGNVAMQDLDEGHGYQFDDFGDDQQELLAFDCDLARRESDASPEGEAATSHVGEASESRMALRHDSLVDGESATARSTRDEGEVPSTEVVNHTRRRLGQKTSPSVAAALGYVDLQYFPAPEAELATTATAAAARLRNRGVLPAHAQKARTARRAAWSDISRQPELVAPSGDERGPHDTVYEHAGAAEPAEALVIPACWDAHRSHEVSSPLGSNLVFCRRCGAWSAGHRTRGLAQPCRGAVAHRGNMRLLTLGIAPVKGARVPAALKAAGSRGTRGGSATKGLRGRRRGSR